MELPTMRRRGGPTTETAVKLKRKHSDMPSEEEMTSLVGKEPDAVPPSSENDDDDLSFKRLLPAVGVSTLVASGTYFAADEEFAFDIVECTLRTFVQLSALAAVLGQVMDFAERKKHSSSLAAPLLVVGYIFCFMLPLAAWEASSRSKLTLRLPGDERIVLKIVAGSLAIAVALVGSIALLGIVRPTPRYSPRHAIPICGMLFNNSLSGISLALAVLFADLESKQRDAIELMLSFGLDPFTATRPSFRAAMSASLRPQINSMNVIGLVSIPGMMTGNVLAGASPRRAAGYQIMIMCLILASNFLSVGIATELILSNAFDDRGGLRQDWIITNPAPRVSQIVSTLSFSSAIEANEDAVNAKAPPTTVGLVLSDSTKVEDAKSMFQVSLHGPYARGERIMNIDFALPLNGAIAVLEGQSGIGKSTLLRTITSLNSGFEGSATITLGGEDRLAFEPSEWRRRVLYITQDGASSIPGTAAMFIESISLSLDNVDQILDAWGMPKTSLGQPFSSLSGGESQRVLLAIALASTPSMLLLDEPTSALDESTKLLIETSLKEKSKSCSIILVTHDDDQKRRLGTMMLTMEEI